MTNSKQYAKYLNQVVLGSINTSSSGDISIGVEDIFRDVLREFNIGLIHSNSLVKVRVPVHQTNLIKYYGSKMSIGNISITIPLALLYLTDLVYSNSYWFRGEIVSEFEMIDIHFKDISSIGIIPNQYSSTVPAYTLLIAYLITGRKEWLEYLNRLNQ